MNYENAFYMRPSVKKLFRSLIRPAFWMFFIESIYTFFSDLYFRRFCFSSFLMELLTKIIWCSGVPFKIGSLTISALGMQWFLVSLFFAKLFILGIIRITSKFVRCKYAFYGALSIILLICGWLFGQNHLWLPGSLDLCFFSLSYLTIGHHIGPRGKNIISNSIKNKFVFSTFIWVGTLILQAVFGSGYFELASRKYTLFPICYLCSIAGSIAVCLFSQMLNSNTIFFKTIKIIGRNSLVLLFIHKIDYWYRSWFINVCSNNVLLIVFRLITDIAVLYFVIILRKCRNQNRERVRNGK